MTDKAMNELRERLDALGAAIVAKVRHLDERGLFDPEATELHVRDVSIATLLDATGAEGLRTDRRSAIDREIDALALRFKLWVARLDRRHSQALPGMTYDHSRSHHPATHAFHPRRPMAARFRKTRGAERQAPRLWVLGTTPGAPPPQAESHVRGPERASWCHPWGLRAGAFRCGPRLASNETPSSGAPSLSRGSASIADAGPAGITPSLQS